MEKMVNMQDTLCIITVPALIISMWLHLFFTLKQKQNEKQKEKKSRKKETLLHRKPRRNQALKQIEIFKKTEQNDTQDFQGLD